MGEGTIFDQEMALGDIPDRVAKTFDKKVVLLTGGTGFVGKVLLEKLLRKCPNIARIILLIRYKKDKDPKQRLEQIFQGVLFEQLLKDRGMEYLLARTRCVSGDMSLANLSLSEADREICRSANIIVHSAASVRFDEGLKKAVFLNARGTKSMLQLAKECDKLELFVHVSTAYCHPEVDVLEEKSYPPPADPHKVITILETTDSETINVFTPKLLGKWPNTYAYSKALAEALVVEQMKDLPVVILRPSIVIPIYKEPLPGWTDNINGPAGLLIAGGKGVLRSMYGDENSFADFLPVDMFANGLMITAWNFLQNGDTEQRVLNYTSSDEIRLSWAGLLDLGRDIGRGKYPLNNVAWYPGGGMTRSRLYHKFRVYMFHLLPALLVDTLLFCLGIKPVLLRVHRRISKGMDILEYYTSNQWEFKSDYIQNLRNRLNERERIDYKVDSEGFVTKDYFEVCTLACRRYILKESDDTLPAARRHMKIMWCVDRFVKMLIVCTAVYWAYKWTSNCGVFDNWNVLIK